MKLNKKQLILVDSKDDPVGEASKLEAHLGKGKRHRAFTAILKNNKGEILMARRSLKKPLWPTFWDFSFSSHPRIGESLEKACERRVKEELGIKVQGFKRLFSYEYHESWNEVFSEWEINHILLANYTGSLKLNSQEVAEFKWLKWPEVVKWLKSNKKMVVPWVLITADKINQAGGLGKIC